jgi:DNA repair protein RadC
MKQTVDQVAEIQVSYRPAITTKPIVKTSLDAFAALQSFYSKDTIALQEKFCVMYLNRSNRVIGVYELSKGGMTSTIVDIRLLLSVCLKVAAVGVVLSHNHPSGNLQPSKCDKDLTQKIKSACSLLDIQVLDHLIVTPDHKYYSMSDEGIL